jgi:hypothetical protein
MMSKIIELIETLKNIENEDSIKVRELFSSKILSNKNSLVRTAMYLACDTLTNEKGLNYENMAHVEESGFNIFPLEMDAFGWITGGIQTSRGVVMFG